MKSIFHSTGGSIAYQLKKSRIQIEDDIRKNFNFFEIISFVSFKIFLGLGTRILKIFKR